MWCGDCINNKKLILELTIHEVKLILTECDSALVHPEGCENEKNWQKRLSLFNMTRKTFLLLFRRREIVTEHHVMIKNALKLWSINVLSLEAFSAVSMREMLNGNFSSQPVPCSHSSEKNENCATRKLCLDDGRCHQSCDEIFLRLQNAIAVNNFRP